jgi:hypothetical protein
MPEKLVFFGKGAQGKTKICVKFVRRYSKDAHLFCASSGFAPELRGFQELPGGWFMVVMDDISDTHESGDSNPSFLFTLRERITEKIAAFHQAHFVHGDLRDTNLMVRRDQKPGFMLVDFDWAGRSHEVRYPSNLNTQDIKRPKGACDGQYILAEHDVEMLEYLLG